MIACSALYKQLCWEFGVSHNCVCTISKGPLISIVTCLETFCNINKLFEINIKILFYLTCISLSTNYCGVSDLPLDF